MLIHIDTTQWIQFNGKITDEIYINILQCIHGIREAAAAALKAAKEYVGPRTAYANALASVFTTIHDIIPRYFLLHSWCMCVCAKA